MTRADTATLARLFDVSPRYVRKLVAQGVLYRARDPETGEELMGRFDLARSITAYMKFLRERNLGEGDPGELTYRQLRIDKMRSEAELAEIRLRALKATLHRAEDVCAIMTARDAFIRARFERITAQLTPQLLGQSEFQNVWQIMTDAVERALSDIRSYDPATDPALVAYLAQICTTSPKPEEALVDANGNGEAEAIDESVGE